MARSRRRSFVASSFPTHTVACARYFGSGSLPSRSSSVSIGVLIVPPLAILKTVEKLLLYEALFTNIVARPTNAMAVVSKIAIP